MRVRQRGRSLLIAIVAMVMSRAYAASGSSITGELVETYCWATMQLAGAAHASCGIECAKRGIPVGVYDRKSRTVFVLLPARDKSALPAALINQMGRQVTIRGDVVARGGTEFLMVREWESAPGR